MNTRSGDGRRGARVARIAVFIITSLLASAAVAQASWPVTALIPESLSVRTPDRPLNFDLTDNYPPAEFPARYLLQEGRIPVQIQSSITGEWLLELTIEGAQSADGQVALPTDQIEYRVSGLGTDWRAATGLPEVIFVGTGPTDGWLDLWIELRIVIKGPERAGPYSTYLTLDAVTTGL